MLNDYFSRPLTNADKAALIVVLVNGLLPDYSEEEIDNLCWCYCALTGQTEEQAKRAFEDATRFGLIRHASEEDDLDG